MEIALLLFLPIVAIFAAVTWIVWQVGKGLRFLLARLFRGLGRLLRRVLGFVRAELVDARNRLEEAQVARANAEARMAEMEAAPNPDPKTEGRRENEPALARVGSALIELVRLVTPFLTPTEKS